MKLLGTRQRGTGETCVILEEFLVNEELQRLWRFALQLEARFQPTRVLSRDRAEGYVDLQERRSRVLFELEEHAMRFEERLRHHLPYIHARLAHVGFDVGWFETQLTTTSDGGYFRRHIDNGHPRLQSREITFVYFFGCEPQRFRGGQLKLYGSDGPMIIEPLVNQMVLFSSGLEHEVAPVDCPSSLFRHGRFTINGWIHREERDAVR